MSTPEQKIFAQLKSAFTKSLPKGRWMLQRIETSTGTGVPDVYCSLSVATSNGQAGYATSNGQAGYATSNEPAIIFWIETKTTEYKVTNEQLNWASIAWLTGTPSFIVTLASQPQNSTNTSQINAPYTPLAWLTATSNRAPQANPCPTKPELAISPPYSSEVSQLNVPYNRYQTKELPPSGQQKAPAKKTQPGPELILLAFDERMRDCSSLGVYLRRFNPPSLLVSNWLATFQ